MRARREVEEQQQRAQTQAQLITELDARYKKLTEEYERLQAQLQAELTPSQIAPVFLTLSVEDFRNSGAQGPQALGIPMANGSAVATVNS